MTEPDSAAVALSETNLERAWAELQARARHWWFLVLSGVVGAVASGLVQAYGDDPMTAALIGVGAALAPSVLLFAYLFIVAPYRQRDEARRAALHYQELVLRTDQTRAALDGVEEVRAKLTELGPPPDPGWKNPFLPSDPKSIVWSSDFSMLRNDIFLVLRRNGFEQLAKPFDFILDWKPPITTDQGSPLPDSPNNFEQYETTMNLLDDCETRLLAELGQLVQHDVPTAHEGASDG